MQIILNLWKNFALAMGADSEKIEEVKTGLVYQRND